VLSQEHLERVQLLRDTLDVVQSVDTNDNFAPLETLLKRLESGLDRFAAETVDKLHGLDTDRVCADLSISALELDTVGHGLETEDSGARGEEVPSVVVRMESARQRHVTDLVSFVNSPNQVTLKHTEEDFSSNRKDSAH